MAKSKENPTLLQSGLQKVQAQMQAAMNGAGEQLKRRPRVWIGVGVGVVLCVAVGVMLAVNGAPDWKVLDTVTQTAIGKPTLAELQAQVKKEPKNAEAWLDLGHAQWDAGKKMLAMRSYDQALTLDKSLASARVAENLTSCFGDKCQQPAAAQIVEHKMTGAADKLVELSTDKRYPVRTGAVNTLEKLGLSSKVDYVAVYKLDLQSNDCDVKRYAVEQLGKLGDKRGVAAIRAARKKEEAETPWYAFDCIGGRADKAEEQILAKK